MAKENKTNAMRIMEKNGCTYSVHSFYEDPDNYIPVDESNSLELVGLPADRVFKTIVTRGKSGNFFVFMSPVNRELDLKKCALAVKEKSVEPIAVKELLPITGYIRGGCSPIGMKKQFTLTTHETAQNFETIVFSAGRVGLMMETSPSSLVRCAKAQFCDIVRS